MELEGTNKKALTIICVGVEPSYGHQSYEDSNLEGQEDTLNARYVFKDVKAMMSSLFRSLSIWVMID